MKPRKYIIDDYIVEQATDGDVTVKTTDDSSDFIRAHVKFYRRISKRDALRMISSVRFLSETEGLY